MMRYYSAVTQTTVNGRGNPKRTSARWPRYVLLRPFRAHRSRIPMAAPGGASFGWAGFAVRPVFHPRSCAAAPISYFAAAPERSRS